MAKSRLEIANFSNVGSQLDSAWLSCSGSAGEAVCRGREDYVARSVEDSARRSEGGGGSMGYRFFRRPPTFWFVCLGFWIVCLWFCVLSLGDCRFVQIAPDSSR